MRKGTQQWLEIAIDDYDTGLYLFKGAKHPQAIYFICQALEKILKAAQIEVAGQAPRKIHHLDTIARSSGLPFTDKQLETLAELSRHYRRVRYPDIQRYHYNTKAKAQQIIRQAEKLFLWTKQQLNNH